MDLHSSLRPLLISFFFFFNDTATTEIYTLSLHDALPISVGHDERPELGCTLELPVRLHRVGAVRAPQDARRQVDVSLDRKSTRLNSSHLVISYAVFCLKKKKK